MIIVFSKNRAFQLEACLRSLVTQCQDVEQVPVRVVWTASEERHERAYAELIASFAARPNIEFVRESNFRCDVILLLGGVAPHSWRERAVRFLVKASAAWNRSFLASLIDLFLRPAPVVLFTVDDSIFFRPFSYRECAARLQAKEDALAFSLRLGRGLTYFYMGRCDQAVPELVPAGEEGIYQYRWPEQDGDFAYPLEVSSSLIKSSIILSRLLRKPWRTPNSLELALANMSGRYKQQYPMLLTFEEPRAVSVPLNMVQQDLLDNRNGGQDRYHADSLCTVFLEGGRADLSALDRVRLNSVHAEIELLPAGK